MKSMIGHKFALKWEMFGLPLGSIGYAFSEYPDFDDPMELGVQIIFQNGNYDGFGVEEQNMFLTDLGMDERYANYNFTNVMQVTRDFNRGYWKW